MLPVSEGRGLISTKDDGFSLPTHLLFHPGTLVCGTLDSEDGNGACKLNYLHLYARFCVEVFLCAIHKFSFVHSLKLISSRIL